MILPKKPEEPKEPEEPPSNPGSGGVSSQELSQVIIKDIGGVITYLGVTLEIPSNVLPADTTVKIQKMNVWTVLNRLEVVLTYFM